MFRLKKVKYNCLEAQRNGIKLQHKHPIGVLKWLRLKYHLLYCKICRSFLTDSYKIDKSIHEHISSFESTPPDTLSQEEKNKIQSTIDSHSK